MSKTGLSSPVWLDPADKVTFPDAELAMTEPNGLLAVGGDLSEQRLLTAYRSGIFPWYSDRQPILWWSPNPRAVLFLDAIRITRSLKKNIRNRDYAIRCDTAFEQVIRACASNRRDGLGTWITQEMARAYIRMHQLGHAHSIEIWQDTKLVGGLYGMSIGRIFFGESMFSVMRDASKIALTALAKYLKQYHFALIDCQVESAHVMSLGARCIPRQQFIRYLNIYSHKPADKMIWHNFPDKTDLAAML